MAGAPDGNKHVRQASSAKKEILFSPDLRFFLGHMGIGSIPFAGGRPEEYGWRGFALPHLLKKRSALVASLTIAVFWMLWHIPISPMLKHLSFLGLFLLEVIPLTVFFSWLYINSRGSVLLVVLYHLVYNMVVNVLNIPASTSGDEALGLAGSPAPALTPQNAPIRI